MALGLAELDAASVAAANVEPSLQDRIESALTAAGNPMTVAALQKVCRVRTATLCAVLADLVEQQRVVKTTTGYRAAPK